MGWSNYLINKDRTIALEIGKNDSNDLLGVEMWSNLEEFIEYMSNTEDRDLSVINYLWNKVSLYNAIDGMLTIFIEHYSDEGWEVVSEVDLEKYSPKIIIRR